MWPQNTLISGVAGTFFQDRTFDGFDQKIKKSTFSFCIHDATLGADLATFGCRIDMVDGALKRVDVACFNPNIEIVSWGLFLLENSFEFQEFWTISVFFENFFLVGLLVLLFKTKKMILGQVYGFWDNNSVFFFWKSRTRKFSKFLKFKTVF